MQLVFATNNENKLKEIRNIIGGDIDLLCLKNFNINDEIPENEPTLEGNAIYKARHVHNTVRLNVFADDTGLEVEALGGLPGVHSARFAGDSKDSEANIDKLLSLLGSSGNRNARFRTVIALIIDEKEFLFEGIAEGTIIHQRRGREGFGYDPVFVPAGHNRTFAEMTLHEKNLISHRAMAFQKLKAFLSGFLNPDNKEPV